MFWKDRLNLSLGINVVPADQGFGLLFREVLLTHLGMSAKLLIIHAPVADAYFVALQALWGQTEPPTPEEESALMKRYGLEPVESQP